MFNITLSVFTIFYIVIATVILTAGVWMYFRWRSSLFGVVDDENSTTPNENTSPFKDEKCDLPTGASFQGTRSARPPPAWMKRVARATGEVFGANVIFESQINTQLPPPGNVKIEVLEDEPSGQTERITAPTIPVYNSADSATKRGRQVSSFQKMGHSVFEELLRDSGGDIEKYMRSNVRLDCIKNPKTGRRLELDSYYDDGTHKIAVEWQGIQHIVYPNHIHHTIDEFEAQKERDYEKARAAAREGIIFLYVPYTVDRCIADPKEPTGYRFDKTVTEDERKLKIKKFLVASLFEALNKN